ncbi:protein of unknown function [Candidatus Nitrosocosmicus franklandus]|uniref:Uncharacterized protein n=1 Tax=Candidatus Nitrosocosmicus franklandianus TaxID=1798806 RepID=A0A484I5Z2_9ARCH|nr:protein of unknown function [Candidatus Nitrosocosmicus franklandus]
MNSISNDLKLISSKQKKDHDRVLRNTLVLQRTKLFIYI